MTSSISDTPFSTIYTAAVDSGDAATIQAAMVALQSSLSVSTPTPSGFYLSGVSWSPIGGASPTNGTFIFQWTHT